MVTRSPRTRLVWIPSRNASNARVACVRVSRASNAILPTRSLLFTRHSQCPRLISKCDCRCQHRDDAGMLLRIAPTSPSWTNTVQ
jgi:hypothetical protein